MVEDAVVILLKIGKQIIWVDLKMIALHSCFHLTTNNNTSLKNKGMIFSYAILMVLFLKVSGSE